MATSIYIKRTGKNPGGTIPVGINGKISQVPVGVDTVVGDDVLEALQRHGVDYRLASVPRVTAGYSEIPGTGKGVAIGINGVVSQLPVNTEFQPTAAQQDVIDHSGVSQIILTGGGSIVVDRVIEYSQAMGATDATGLLVSLPLRAASGARRIWANTSLGNDGTYNGLSPYPGFKLNGTGAENQDGATGPGTANAAYGPKATFKGAYDVIPAPTVGSNRHEGHQVFLCESQTFAETGMSSGSYWLENYQGYSIQFPFAIQSYDPADPLNEAKHGRAIGTKRPKLACIVTGGVGTVYNTTKWSSNIVDVPFIGGIVYRGIKFDSGTDQGNEFGLNGNCANILFENCVGRGLGAGAGGFDAKIRAKNVIFRKFSCGENWKVGGHAAAMGNGYLDGFICEDVIIYHGGWKVGGDRNAVDGSGADIFKQGAYASYGGLDQNVYRRCVFVDNSASGLSGRGHMFAYHNVCIDNPIQMVGGGSISNYATENPTGVVINYDYNLIMGGDDITSSLPRGNGVELMNGRVGSTGNYNLFVNGIRAGTAPFVFRAVAEQNQPSYMTLQGNHAFNFSSTFDIGPTATSFPAQTFTTLAPVKTTFAGAIVTDNVNLATSPATNNQFYAALGYASKDAMMADAMEKPEEPWAYRIMIAASALFNSHDFQLSDGTGAKLTKIPYAPQTPVAVAGDTKALVSFVIPASSGGADITSYTVTATPPSGPAITASGPKSPVIVSGLTNGTAYTITVTATNAKGTGPASSSTTVTPAATGGTLADDLFNSYPNGGLDRKQMPTYGYFWATLASSTLQVFAAGGVNAYQGNTFDIQGIDPGASDVRADSYYTTTTTTFTNFDTAVVARGSLGSNTFISAEATDLGVRLYVPSSASPQWTTSGVTTTGTNRKLSLTVVGDTVKVFLDDVQVGSTYTLTTTDKNLLGAGTRVGFGFRKGINGTAGREGGGTSGQTTLVTRFTAKLI